MSNEWKYWGKLKAGGMVFVTESGRVAIERDQSYLVDATPEEKQEIYMMWPELLGEVKKYKVPREKTDQDMIAGLRENIKDLVVREVEREKVIDALKYGNEEKEKMILTLMEDIAEGKGRILALDARNWRWKEEVERRDGTIDALMARLKDGRK